MLSVMSVIECLLSIQNVCYCQPAYKGKTKQGIDICKKEIKL